MIKLTWAALAAVATIGAANSAMAQKSVTIVREIDTDRYDPHKSTSRSGAEVMYMIGDTMVNLDYDMKTLKQLDRIDSGGLHPHEIQEIPGTDELIATHYGDDYAKMPPFAHNLIEPKLTVYDAKTLQVKRHYVQPGYHAMVTHMRVTKDKNAYFVLTQYIDGAIVPTPKDSQGKKIKTTALSRADAELEKFLGHKRDFPIPYEAAQELMIPLPLPFVCLNIAAACCCRNLSISSTANCGARRLMYPGRSSSQPAATSHAFNPFSQNPSIRPQATHAISMAAAPNRRTAWAWFRNSRQAGRYSFIRSRTS